jgi:catechol 2,3-dioxygenase-like lactoylglutathione lyase family enzyme
VTGTEPRKVCRIARFSLTSADAEALCGFYEQAFGFRCIARRRHSGVDFERITGVSGGATGLTLMLGEEAVEFLEFDTPGSSYPASRTSSDSIFQHLALVVTNMESAYRQLLKVPGWTPISTGAPELLPETSGSVTAFKFRDPEGHPLELLAFPTASMPVRWKATAHSELFLGIDHSAISVSDTARSLTFYRRLGLSVCTQTLNSGPEQQRLDALNRPEVTVTALSLPDDGPHLELLCYLNVARAATPVLRNNDVAAARTVFEMATEQAASAGSDNCLCDPDGHHVQMISLTPKPRR